MSIIFGRSSFWLNVIRNGWHLDLFGRSCGVLVFFCEGVYE